MSRLLLLLLAGLAGAADAAGFPPAPAVTGDVWINSAPLSPEQQRGKVLLVEFWTFACWNCRNVQPHVKQWHADYADQGLLILAVHSPEFPREAKIENVKNYVRDNDIRYPVLVDNDFVTWKRFGNQAWPALYLIDRAGRIRYSHVGEGAYAETEREIRQLLAEAALRPAPGKINAPPGNPGVKP